MKKQFLQANWIHTDITERFLEEMKIGRTINVCCGMSKVGDVRIDIDSKSNRTEEGDLFKLKYTPRSFDTVICDPPFSYYNRFRWILKLSNIADKRFLLSCPNIQVRLPARNWKRSLWYEEGNTLFLRTYWRFDRTNSKLVA